MKRAFMVLLLIWGLSIAGCGDDGGESTSDAGSTDEPGGSDDTGSTSESLKWMTSWVSAQQLSEPNNLPPNPGLANNTLRQRIFPSLGGDHVRITFSNAYGDGPLTVVSSGVALTDEASVKAIVTDTHTPLTFSGEASVTIAAGETATSDPVAFEVTPFKEVTVSMLFDDNPPSDVTGHPGARSSSFIQPGDAVDAATVGGLAFAHWYILSALDVSIAQETRSIVIMGDSITDGRESTTNGNDRWPNALDRRLKENAGTENISVLNQGIGGNCVSRFCLGPSFGDRFESDVLGPLGVKHLILFGGINDIGSSSSGSSQSVIDVLEQLAGKAHDNGIIVIGATIMPCEGFNSYYNEGMETKRQAINAWIRTTDSFDAVIDFDEITRDPDAPTKLREAVDSGDHLHPDAAGYKIMADAIDLTLFDL